MERKATQKSCHLWGSVLVEDLLQSLAKVSLFLRLLFIPYHTLFEFKPVLCEPSSSSKSIPLVRVKNVSKDCSTKESLDSARAEGCRQPTHGVLCSYFDFELSYYGQLRVKRICPFWSCVLM